MECTQSQDHRSHKGRGHPQRREVAEEASVSFALLQLIIQLAFPLVKPPSHPGFVACLCCVVSIQEPCPIPKEGKTTCSCVIGLCLFKRMLGLRCDHQGPCQDMRSTLRLLEKIPRESNVGQCTPSLRGDQDLPYLNCLRAACCRTDRETSPQQPVHIWTSLMECNGGIFKK